jgi:hypothetical protein
LNSHKIPAEIRGCPTRFKLYELRKGPLAVNLGAGVKLETLTLRFQLIKARTQIAAWLDEEFQGEGRLTPHIGQNSQTSLPPAQHRLGLAGSVHDLGRAAAVRCKYDLDAPDVRQRRVG